MNVSARQFRTPGFVEHVLTLINRHGLAPNLLTLEITESLLLAEPEEVREDLSILRNAASRWRSTTSAPGTRRCRTCTRCRPTS